MAYVVNTHIAMTRLSTFCFNTPLERITRKANDANAIGCMTDDSTFGVLSASARARISTFLVNASKMIRTFAVTDTLRSTIGRGTYKFWQARARGRTVYFFALCVRSAR